MAIYRFHIEIEDHNNLFREIEIKSSQTFQDLHFSILHAYNFNLKHAASFFYSDDLWHMEDEIAFELLPYSQISCASPMSKVRISDYIDDPHQRFLYVYQSDEGWVFLLELVDINTAAPKSGENYPQVVKCVGEAPKQYSLKSVLRPIPDDLPVGVVEELADAATEPAADDLVVFETLEAGAQCAPKEAEDDPLSLGGQEELGVDSDDLHGMGEDQGDEDGITDDDDQGDDAGDDPDDDKFDDDDDYSGGRDRGSRGMAYDSDDY
ncbi:MAG: plasmid pRiA4b ORF-3 family protein [Sphingomonadales bacterium]|nr:plasmid pRiA4b ORF-3 family protein [Sphingomonadales bacterium]